MIWVWAPLNTLLADRPWFASLHYALLADQLKALK